MPPAPFQKLGRKTFIFMLVERSGSIVLLIIALIVILGLQLFTAPYLHSLSADQIQAINQSFTIGVAGLVFLIFFIAACILGITWLEYTTYRFCIDEESFKVRHGIFSTQETSLMYRQIQNVDVERPLLYRLFGLSRVVILTAGHEDADDENKNEAEGILPILDVTQAKEIQDELIRRSNIQEVVEVPASARV